MTLSGKEALSFIQTHKKVAIVGLSANQDRPSFQIGRFLQGQGFQITPINPTGGEILGIRAKASLAELAPGEVDWIDLFLNPTRLPDLLPEILRLQPKLLWCQLGVVNEEFNQAIEQAGIPLIFDHCPKIEWNLHG